MNKKQILYFLLLLVVISGAGQFIKKHYLSLSMVQGSSMEPNLFSNDILIIKKWDSQFKAGDVVVLHPPNSSNSNLIVKRIVAGPDSRVYIEEFKLYVNDKLVNEADMYDVIWSNKSFECRYSDEYTTKDGEYFVLGDNRCAAYDSRHMNSIKAENIVGKLLYRISLFSIFRKWL